MKILLISPWKNVWVDYFKKYYESLGHTFTFSQNIDFFQIAQQDIVISGWADKAAVYLSNYPKLAPKYYCFMRSYEFYHTDYTKINFNAFDKVFFVNQYIMDKMGLPNSRLTRNAIDLDRIKFKEHDNGNNIMLLADINFKKGIPLLVQVARQLKDYTLNIYGRLSDQRLSCYLEHCNLSNIKYKGYAEDIQSAFDENNYIILTSPVEGNPNCIIEGMAAGLKPIVHRFVGSQGQFPQEVFWDRIDEAATMIIHGKYDSRLYRRFVEENYNYKNVYSTLLGE